jgi:hypothetical protein
MRAHTGITLIAALFAAGAADAAVQLPPIKTASIRDDSCNRQDFSPIGSSEGLDNRHLNISVFVECGTVAS